VAFLNANGSVRVQVEGHCDERGTNAYNMVLGERRATAAKQYVTTAGVSAGRVSTISYGEERPLDPGHNEAAWAKNRRAHFVVTGQ
jgi:peptidoglycan-associated lipoprotein